MFQNTIGTNLYIGRKYLLFVLLCIIIYVSGCVTALNFETLSTGHYCSHVEKANYVINYLDEWTHLLERSHLDVTKLPEINFTNYTVIAAFMGEQKTGGYKIEIKKIQDSGKEIMVYIKEKGTCQRSHNNYDTYPTLPCCKGKKDNKACCFQSRLIN